MAQKSYLVVTSFGTDRPGIVAEISGWILEHGGNIEDSRMSLLGGEFTTMILVSGDKSSIERLETSREQFQRSNELVVFTKRVVGERPALGANVVACELEAHSLDHPGIVHQVAQFLRHLKVNIVSAETRVTSAPFSGAPVFQIVMRIEVPAGVTVEQLRTDLDALGASHDITFSLTTLKA